MVTISSTLKTQNSESILFVVPGCIKCEKAKTILSRMGVSYTTYNIFEHRSLLQNVPIEKKRQGFPLLKTSEAYFTYDEIMLMDGSVSAESF